MHDNWVDTDGTVASVEVHQGRYGTSYEVVFTYEVAGHWCGGTFTTTQPYRQGDTIALSYNPADPDQNNLVERETKRNWIIGGMAAAGGILLLYLFFGH